MNMAISITVIRKLVPQRGWKVVYACAFLTVSGSLCLEGENRLVLGAVILVHAPDVGPQRDAPDEQQEQADADDAVDHVEQDLVAEGRDSGSSAWWPPAAAQTCT